MKAIMRYLGKLCGAYPSCPIKAALVDAILDEENDLFTGLTVSRYQARFGFACIGLEENKPLLTTIRKELNDVVLPRHLSFLENLMSSSTTGWIADTDEPSIADFILAPRLKWLASGANDGISKEILASYPSLTNMMIKLRSLPSINQYYLKNVEK